MRMIVILMLMVLMVVLVGGVVMVTWWKKRDRLGGECRLLLMRMLVIAMVMAMQLENADVLEKPFEAFKKV